MALEHAIRFPVLTVRSGPANSLRGAAHLSRLHDAVVADIGGTSTEIGVLINGYPRESSFPADIAGIRTNSRMPDVVSLPLGGGSIISSDGRRLRVGPDSVGYELPARALVFGGATATLTDAAVAGGRAELGTMRLAQQHQRRRLRAALEHADEMLTEAIDRAKLSSAPCPLVLVGGGSIVAADEIAGVSEIVRPDGFDVANAIGAAIAPVSGHAERICPNRPDVRNAAIEATCAEAVARAVHAGADARRVEVIEVDQVPLTYLVDAAVQIRVKAVGPRL
jgi:N-methylhydantoinase A/oxoprolinase/acetone carboxylase beta subunit